jgi:Mg-chelatase subunit ChlD
MAEAATAAREDALGHLLHALAGAPVALQWQRAGDPAQARPILQPGVVLLPPALADDPRQATAAIAHAAGHLRFSTPAQAPGKLKAMGISVVSLIEDARIEHLMIQRFPGLRRTLLAAAQASYAAGVGAPDGFSDLLARLHLGLLDPARADAGYWVDKGRRLFAAAADRLDDPEPFRRLGEVIAADLGQMRVRMNLHGEPVPYAYGDDHSFLWQHGKSSDDSAQEIVQHSPPPDAAPGEPQPAAAVEAVPHVYPEWHERLERLRPDWVTVRESRFVAPGEAPAGRTRPPPRVRQRQWLDRSVRLRRQWEGDDIDLDAAIEHLLDLRTGQTPDGGLHLRTGRGPRPRSLLVLVDLSVSSAERTADGTPVMDCIRAAATALVAAAAAAGDTVAVHGFCSDGRHAVDYVRIADFGEADAQAVDARLAALVPHHSTRLGAAIRHATELLGHTRTPRRQLVVLGDGVPYDIDVFEPGHLAADAREAVRAARRSGIEVAALAFDTGEASVPVGLFGRRHTRVLLRAESLRRLLGQLGEVLAA